MFIYDIFKTQHINEGGSDTKSYIQPDKGATPSKTTTDKQIDIKPVQEPKSKKDPKEYMIKSVGEDAIDDRLAAQYSTPQAKTKTQAIDQAFASGQQADFDKLGIMSPQQIERDYQAMRAKEPAQDAALMRNPALTPGARTQTFKTNPKGVPIREQRKKKELSNFEKAFAAARDKGAKEFTWYTAAGKPYQVTTRLKGEKQAPKTSASVVNIPANDQRQKINTKYGPVTKGSEADYQRWLDQQPITKKSERDFDRQRAIDSLMQQVQEPMTPAPRTPEELAQDELWADIRAHGAGKSPEEIRAAAEQAMQEFEAEFAADKAGTAVQKPYREPTELPGIELKEPTEPYIPPIDVPIDSREQARRQAEKDALDADSKYSPLQKKFDRTNNNVETPDEKTLKQQEQDRWSHYDAAKKAAQGEILGREVDGKVISIPPGHPEYDETFDDLYKQQNPGYPTPNDPGFYFTPFRYPGEPEPAYTKALVEGGPFSYGAKKPRKGSVADLAAKKRKEQERGRQPIEPKDQRVGVAKVTKDVAEGRGNIEALRTELMGEYLNIYYNALDGWNMTDHIINLQDVYGRVKRSRDPVLQQTYNLLMDHAEESIDVQASAALKAIRILGDEPNYTPPPRPPMSPEDSARADAFVNQFLAALVSHGIKTHPDWQKNNDKGVAEGSVQDKLHKRHQELRKKSGLPDPNYYKELKASYDLPDAERYAKQKEIKQKYKVTNEDRERYIEELGRAGYEIVTEAATLCPECGGIAYGNQMLAEKQDACYHKVKSRYKVWPSAYASGALVRCRKKGAANWGNKSKK